MNNKKNRQIKNVINCWRDSMAWIFLLINGRNAMHLISTLRSCVLSCVWQRIGESKPRTKYVMHFAIVNESAAMFAFCASMGGLVNWSKPDYPWKALNTINRQMRILNIMRIGEKSMGGLDCTLNVANVIYYYTSQRRHWVQK